MPDDVKLFHPNLSPDEAFAALAYQDLIHVPNGPFLEQVEDLRDAWGRSIRVYRSTSGDIVNYVSDPASGMHFAHARGELALNITVLIGSALVAADALRLSTEDVIAAARDPEVGEMAVGLATALVVGNLESTNEIDTALLLLAGEPENRVPIAEVIGYRCLPRQIALVQQLVRDEADAERKASLELLATGYQALLDLGPGAAALARVPGNEQSPLLHRILEIGPPGSHFATP